MQCLMSPSWHFSWHISQRVSPVLTVYSVQMISVFGLRLNDVRNIIANIAAMMVANIRLFFACLDVIRFFFFCTTKSPLIPVNYVAVSRASNNCSRHNQRLSLYSSCFRKIIRSNCWILMSILRLLQHLLRSCSLRLEFFYTTH